MCVACYKWSGTNKWMDAGKDWNLNYRSRISVLEVGIIIRDMNETVLNFRFSLMEDHVKFLCQELVAELAENALDNCEMSPAPVESFLQANSKRSCLNSTNYGSHCCQSHSAEPHNPPVSLAWTQNRRAVKTSVLCQTTCCSVPASPSQGKKLTPLQDHFEWAIEKCIHIQVARGECESASIKRIEQQLKSSIFLYQLGLNSCLKLLR